MRGALPVGKGRRRNAGACGLLLPGVEALERRKEPQAFRREAAKPHAPQDAGKAEMIVVARGQPHACSSGVVGRREHRAAFARGIAVKAQHTQKGSPQPGLHGGRVGKGAQRGRRQKGCHAVDSAWLRERKQPLDVVVHGLKQRVRPGKDLRMGAALQVASTIAVEEEQARIARHAVEMRALGGVMRRAGREPPD